ncbi:MAG: PqiC family protein [Puniceicoccales bacterium]|nr:PqiC family protein [Puniceicoccales bacterium]
MRTKIFLRYGLLMIALCGSGCTLFKTTPDRTRLFDIGFSGGQAATSSIDGAKICLVLNNFPDYLDGPQMITKIGQHELKSNPRYRWARPLSETILHIVRRKLQQNFPNVCIYEFPKDGAGKVDFTLQLDVDGVKICEMEQQVIFVGTWAFLDGKQGYINRSDFEFRESFSDAPDHYERIVSQVEQVILHLSDVLIKEMDLILLKRDTEKQTDQ